jgi:hypothetical protein
MSDELERQRAINVKLRKQLERCRQDTVEYCAKFCEDNELVMDLRGSVFTMPANRKYMHEGDGYAKALRGIIGTKFTKTMEGEENV